MVDMALLRALETPDLRLVPGRAVMARVVDQQNGRGQITIAGAKLEAQLPEHLNAGDELRLTVKEITDDKVVLSMSQPTDAPIGAEAPLPPRTDEAENDDADGQADSDGSETHTLSLRYPAPALGPVDLRFDLSDEALRITVALASGSSFSAAVAAASQLRGAVTEATGRAVSVTVLPRHEPVEVYA